MIFLFFAIFVACWAFAWHGKAGWMIASAVAIMFVGLTLGRGADDPLGPTMIKVGVTLLFIGVCLRVYYVRTFTRKGVK